MRIRKTETLPVRLAPDIKASLREAAECEHRGLANMLEVTIHDYSVPSGRHRHRESQALRADSDS